MICYQLTLFPPSIYTSPMRKFQRNNLAFFLIISSLVVVFLFLFTSCAPRVQSFDSLKNQGPLALSSANPTLGANLFLAREAERSSFLFDFLKGRGGPAALEITESDFGSTRLYLYYPRDKEVYAADIQPAAKGDSYQWIVRGPYAIERKDYKNLMRLDLASAGEPIFEIRGRPWRFRFQEEELPQKRISAPLPPPPAPTPRVVAKPKKKVIKVPAEQPQAASAAIASPPPGIPDSSGRFVPLNTDQQALQIAKGFAERADNGDVIHVIKSETETTTLLARWYTGADGNSKEIAEYNGISEAEIFTIGRRVRIPFKLVKQFKAMPADFK